MLPDIGPEVVGASYCPLDGHVNSLRLFRTLHTAINARGVTYLPSHRVENITKDGGEFRLHDREGRDRAPAKVALAAGNANMRLAPMVGLEAPMRPERGQIVVTERLRPFLNYPVVTLRQTDEGTVMIGDSKEESTDPRGLTHRRQRHRGRARGAAVPAARQRQRGAHLERDPGHDPGRLPDLRRIGDASRRLRAVLPFRRDARRQPRAHRGADDRPRRARHVAGRSLQRAEVPCSSRLAEARRRPSRSPSTASDIRARAGDTVAAALLAAGVDHCRTTPVTGAPRAPYCLMGVCFDCLVTIDGVGSRQALPGAGARRHGGRDPAGQARGRAMTTTSATSHRPTTSSSSAAGRPGSPRRRWPRAPACRPCCSTRIPASAARSIAPSPPRRSPTARSWARTTGPARRLRAEAKASGAPIVNGATVWSLDPDRLEIGVSIAGQARMIQARRVIIATGALERPFPIPGWTLPGVMTRGRARRPRSRRRAWCRPGRTVMAGCGPLLWLLAAQLLRAGAKIEAILDTTPREQLAARGDASAGLRRCRPTGRRAWRCCARCKAQGAGDRASTALEAHGRRQAARGRVRDRRAASGACRPTCCCCTRASCPT